MQQSRNLVDRRQVYQRNYRSGFNVGEQGDFFSSRLCYLMIGANNKDIGLQANRTHFLNRMLGRFGLGLTGGGNVRHQRQVNEHGVIGPYLES